MKIAKDEEEEEKLLHKYWIYWISFTSLSFSCNKILSHFGITERPRKQQAEREAERERERDRAL